MNAADAYECLTFISGELIFLSLIKSWTGETAEAIFNRQRARRFPTDLYRVAQRKLEMVHAAAQLADLRIPPANRLEALSGDREGQHSIRINDQWRVCFVWKEGNAYDVEIVDYH